MAEGSSATTSGHQSWQKSTNKTSGLGSRLGLSSPAARKRRAAQNKRYRIAKHQISFGDVFQDWQIYEQESGLKTNDDAKKVLY